VPGPALRDRPLHVQRQRQRQRKRRPAKAGRYNVNLNVKFKFKFKFKVINNYVRVKGRRPLQSQPQRQKSRRDAVATFRSRTAGAQDELRLHCWGESRAAGIAKAREASLAPSKAAASRRTPKCAARRCDMRIRRIKLWAALGPVRSTKARCYPSIARMAEAQDESPCGATHKCKGRVQGAARRVRRDGEVLRGFQLELKQTLDAAG